MQGNLNSHLYLPTHIQEQIATSLKKDWQICQNLMAKILQFGIKHNKRQSYNYGVANYYQNQLYNSNQIYHFQVNFKELQPSLNQILNGLGNIQIKILIENTSKCRTNIERYLQYLKECNQNLLKIKQPYCSQSLQSTLNYLRQLQTTINQIDSNLIILTDKVKTYLRPNSNQSRNRLDTSSIKDTKIESTQKNYAGSSFINDGKKTHDDKNSSSLSPNGEKDDRSLEEMVKQVMDVVSFADNELKKLMPKITHVPSELAVISLNHKKMSEIQNKFNKAVQILPNVYDRVRSQNISGKKTIDETANLESEKGIETQNQQKSNAMKTDYDNQLREFRKNLSNTESFAQTLKGSLQGQSQQIAQKNQLITKLQKQLQDLKSSNSTLLSERTKYNDKISSMSHQIEQLNAYKSNLQIAIKQMESKISQVDSTTETINSLNAQMVRLKQENQDIAAKYSSLEEKFGQQTSSALNKQEQQVSHNPKSGNKKASVSCIQAPANENVVDPTKSSILESDDDRWDNLNSSELGKEQKQILTKVDPLKKEMTTLELKLSHKQSGVSQIEKKQAELSKKYSEQIKAQKALCESFHTTLLDILESINFKSLAEEVNRSHDTVSELSKTKLKRNSEQEQVSESEIEKVKFETISLEKAYKILFEKIKLNLSNPQIETSPIKISDMKQCLAAFEKYTKSELTLMKSKMKMMIKKQCKADGDYSKRTQQMDNLSRQIQTLIQKKQNKQAELQQLESNLEIQKSNQLAADQKYKVFLNNMFDQIADKQRTRDRAIQAQNNQKLLNQKLKEKQQEITQLNTKITSLTQENHNLKTTNSNLNNSSKQKTQLQTELGKTKINLAKTQQQLDTLKQKCLDEGDQVKSLLKGLSANKTQLDREQSSLKGEFQNRIKEISESFEKQKQKIQTLTKEKVNLLTADFNRINKQLSDERHQYYSNYEQASNTLACLNGSLKAIYLANYKYLVKGKNHTQGSDSKLASQLTNHSKVLNEKEALQVVGYSLYAISFVEGLTQKANQYLSESETRMIKIKELLETTNQSKDFTNSLDQIKNPNCNKENIFDEVQIAISTLARKASEQIKDIVNQFNKKLNHEVQKHLEPKQNQINSYQSQITSKNQSIKTLQSEKKQLSIELEEQQDSLKQYQQTNAILAKSQESLKRQNLTFKKQIETLNGVIKQSQESTRKNMQTFNIEKKKLRDNINDLNEELIQKTNRIDTFEKKLNQLEGRFKDSESKNKLSLSSQSQLRTQLKAKQDQLKRKQKQYEAKQRECSNLTRDLEDIKNILNDERRKTSSGSSQTIKLKTEIDKILKEKRDLEQKLHQLQSKCKNFQTQHQQLNNQLNVINSEKNSAVQESNLFKTILKQVELTIREKLNLQKEIDPANLSQTIRNFNPVGAVGCKLITSIIIHGYDSQRSAIIKKIESFVSKKIKRTDVQAKYPEVKSMVYNVPKEGAFIMLYKTSAGRVVGSFSEGLRKKTFIFAYWVEEEDRVGNKTREASEVEFFMPQTPSVNVSSVDLSDRKYLKYGRDELRINLMGMENISADSHVISEKYYNDFQWAHILGDHNEAKVPLDEVELHKVGFE